MPILRTVAIILFSAGSALNASYAFPQTAAANTDAGIRNALGVLNRVVGHTQRLITAHNVARLPHEDGEFKEGIKALEKASAHQPTELKLKVQPLIRQAEERSHALAVAARQPDPAKLDAAHAALADSVSTLIAAFPEAARPQPLQ